VGAVVNGFFRNFPFTAAAVVCGIKASAADLVAQRRQYKKGAQVGGEQEMEKVNEVPQKIDLPRNLAYLLYGSLYQGLFQEYAYNHIYPRLFGAGSDIVSVASKVAFDMLLQTVFLTLPVAYMSKAVIYRYSFREAIRRYVDDIKHHKLLLKYYALWLPVMSFTFGVVPEHYRVAFIACVSFFWIIILSSIASKAPIMKDDSCSFDDGQTC